MAEVKITVEEKLGGQVAFGGREIRILKATYEAVPEEKRAEFDEVLVKAQEVYQEKVALAKKTGVKPQASKLKAEAIAEIINPFLTANSVVKGTVNRGENVRVIKPSIKKDSKQIKEAKSATDIESLEKELDNFPTDMLDDSSEVVVKEEPKGDFDDLEDELGLDDVFGEGDEDVFSESEHKDPFDTGAGDPFDDIDLDI